MDESQVIYAPGQEPEKLKTQIQRFLEKLDSAYPDKVVFGLNTNHKKWGATLTLLYRLLGYPDGKSFLEAYGYTLSNAKGGRPAEDQMIVVNELKKRYANGSGYKSIKDLKAANPDLAPKFKALENKASKLFGMTLTAYFVQEGILAAGGRVRKNEEDCRVEFEKLRLRYAETPFVGTVSEIWDANDDLDWTAIRKYAQSKKLHLKTFLVQEGILSGFEDATKKSQIKSPRTLIKNTQLTEAMNTLIASSYGGAKLTLPLKHLVRFGKHEMIWM